MRSVFVHLWHTSEHDVAAALDRLYPGPRLPWELRIGGNWYLGIDFYRDGPAEDDDWPGRFAGRGGPPAVSVVADITELHDGRDQARDFATRLLSAFDGVATDDGWRHLWTRNQVRDDGRVDGRRFGDW
jgi:hypothetical protein